MYYLGRREGDLKSDQMVLPHEYLANNRVLFLYGPLSSMVSSAGLNRSDAFSPDYLSDTILAMSSKSLDPIVLVIDSDGGMVRDGYTLYDTIKAVKAPVYTVGRGCLSMAAIILAAGSRGNRYLFPNAKVMIHMPFSKGGGDPKDWDIQSKEMQRIRNMIVNSLQENGVNKPINKILKDIDREYWMNSQEAIEYGIADQIVPKGFFENFVMSKMPIMRV